MKTMLNNKKHIGSIAEKGFTLVELLIVVIILAILAAIVVPQFASTTDDARASSADATLAGLRSAIDLYYQQHGEYPGANTAVPTVACVAAGATAGLGALNTDTAVMEQLSRYTDADGGACSISDATRVFGPYLKKSDIPTEPFSGITTPALEVVTVGDLLMVANTTPVGGPGGFKYDTVTGKIIINLLAEQNR